MKPKTEANDAVPRGMECAVHSAMLTKSTFFAVIGILATVVVGYLKVASETYASAEKVCAVEQRLDRSENQIDRRFDSIEKKLDRLLERGNP
jgi:hypothetical protein